MECKSTGQMYDMIPQSCLGLLLYLTSSWFYGNPLSQDNTVHRHTCIGEELNTNSSGCISQHKIAVVHRQSCDVVGMHVALCRACWIHRVFMQPKLRQPRRIFDPAEEVSCTGFFRIHWHPKRFPQAHAVRWRDRVIADMDDFVVVSKPWGVQVTHRVDNVLESLVACMGRVRRISHSCSHVNIKMAQVVPRSRSPDFFVPEHVPLCAMTHAPRYKVPWCRT